MKYLTKKQNDLTTFKSGIAFSLEEILERFEPIQEHKEINMIYVPSSICPTNSVSWQSYIPVLEKINELIKVLNTVQKEKSC